MKKHIHLALRIIVAAILIQTLRFKFTAHPDSVYIFETVGLEPIARIGIGVLELIAGILLIIPKTVWTGATLTLGLIGGAIMMHLTQLGIEVKGGVEAGKKFIESLKMFYHVANIGDARSLAIHPATTTHSQLNEEELLASGVTPGYVRLCIGLEHIDDIISDISNALDAVRS